MCRWFSYISDTEPCLLEDVLITPEHSLSKQVHEHHLPGLYASAKAHGQQTTAKEISTHNRLFNSDGLGVAWYSTTRAKFGVALPQGTASSEDLISLPALYRTIQPPNNDPNFASLARHTSSLVCLAHIRMSTSVVQPFNNHPFTFGRHSFMHNGFIDDFPRVRLEICSEMGPAEYYNVKGSTDSEHMAALYMTYLVGDKGEKGWYQLYTVDEMVTALAKTVNTVCQLQKTKGGSNNKPFEANDLNLCTTDGKKLIACRVRTHATEQPPSLYYSTEAGVKLNRKFPGHPDKNGTDASDHGSNTTRHGPEKQNASQHGKHVIVSSEPTTCEDDEWTVIPKNNVIMVDEKMDVKVVPFDITF